MTFFSTIFKNDASVGFQQVGEYGEFGKNLVKMGFSTYGCIIWGYLVFLLNKLICKLDCRVILLFKPILGLASLLAMTEGGRLYTSLQHGMTEGGLDTSLQHGMTEGGDWYPVF